LGYPLISVTTLSRTLEFFRGKVICNPGIPHV
jgi:hypothetical protein